MLYLGVFALSLLAQNGPAPTATATVSRELLVLAHARNNMVNALRGMPNYICLETIERSRRAAKRKQYQLIDVLRLEVGYVNGKELFSWPGSGKFEDKELTDLVPTGGAIGNGNFASHAAAVFRGGVASMSFVAVEMDGRLRYGYRVPQNLSGYMLRSGSQAEAVVGYHGSFWVDPTTRRVLRIEVVGDDIPPVLEISSTFASIDYGDVRIGEQKYWLPVASALRLSDLNASEFRNEIRFTGCRQFGGESKLSFEEPPPDTADAPMPPKPVEDIVLPPGKILTIDLQQRLRWRTNATGDQVEAVLSSALKHKGQVLLPKGSKVTGRIVRLQSGESAQAIDLAFDTIEGGGKRAPFRAQFSRTMFPAASGTVPGRGRVRTGIYAESVRPGVVSIAAFNMDLDVLKGYHLTWTTVE